jgi:hypothetical protein
MILLDPKNHNRPYPDSRSSESFVSSWLQLPSR